VASVERVKQDIATLQQTASKLAEDLLQTYLEYFKALGQALRQQLILSGYHVCTQGYPTQFLSLSLNQRQALQQAFQDLAKQAQLRLNALLQQSLTKPTEESTAPFDAAEAESNLPAESLATAEPNSDSSSVKPFTIAALVEWQDALEAAIAHEIRAVSLKANRLLQQAGILPNKLPEFLKATSNINANQMEAISKNMLEMLMDAQEEDEQNLEDEPDAAVSIVVQLVAVHLKLSEVEFSDGATTVLRNRLRSLTGRLKTLHQTYRKKERELAIAQAEEAWRAAWFEE
jgi:hypothetical protein